MQSENSDTPGLEIAARVLAELASGVPALLFHYTSSAGLLGILRSHKIWASDTRFLNDRTEGAHGADFCLHELERIRYDGPFGDMCRGLKDHLAVTEFLHFSASFCEDPDLVPQWRGYASGGAGYALGIDSSKLVINADDFALLKVRYRDDDKRDAVRRLINAHADAWSQIATHSRAKRRAGITRLQISLLTGLTLLSLSFKPEVFAYEREWRVVNSVSPAHPEQMAELDFREGAGAIVPFFNLSLLRPDEVPKDSPVREIWVGPIQQNAATASAIAAFCARNELAAEVKVSAAPLRF